MKNFKYTKADLASFIKYNYFLEEILCVNPIKKVYISIKKNARNISWRYEISIFLDRTLFWKKEWNNYLLILDELHEILILRKLLPVAQLKPVSVEIKVDDSIFENDSYKKNENVLSQSRKNDNTKNIIWKNENWKADFKQNRAEVLLEREKEMVKSLKYFEKGLLKWEYDYISDILKKPDWTLEILDSKSWVVWNMNFVPWIWKKLLVLYLYNLPLLFKRNAYVPEIIYVMFWDCQSLKIYVNDLVWDEDKNIWDEEYPFVLFYKSDSLVIRSCLECWIDEIFEKFNVKRVNLICF